MEENQEKLAKELFETYYGSHFFMSRNEVDSLYSSYQVSKEKELEWIKEMQNKSLETLKTKNGIEERYHSFCGSIRQYKSFDVFKQLISIAKEKVGKADTFSDVLLIQGITSCILYFIKMNIKKTTMPPFIEETLELWYELYSLPIRPSEKGMKMAEVNSVGAFEMYIRDRMKWEIARLNKARESLR